MINRKEIGLLINLARADGEISVEELDYLINIGKANKISEEQIMDMLGSEQQEVINHITDDNERLDLLIKLIQLMKCDGKLYKQEIRYCCKVASKLGYEEEVLFELMLNVSSGKISVNDKIALKEKTREYLK